MSRDIKDRATGCLLGALCGDAAGATLEFLQHDPTAEEVAWAMSMPGGGRLKVASGQITDDGELTLCLAQALAESKTFNLERIARNYARWIESSPFDVGMTTINSLGSFRGVNLDEKSYAAVMTRSALKACRYSKANGSLMRNTPLGIWGYNLEASEIANYARQDNALSHPNPSCGFAVACYSIAIATLIRQSGQRELAFNNAKTWLDSQENLAKQQGEYTAWKEVSSWLHDAEYDVDVPYSPHIGFQNCFYSCFSPSTIRFGLSKRDRRDSKRWRRYRYQCLYSRRINWCCGWKRSPSPTNEKCCFDLRY